MNTINPNQDHADSAGQPWAGREFSENTYGTDDGSMPADIQAAFTALHDSHNFDPLLAAFPTARWLIPLIAVAGDIGQTESGLTVDKTQELSIVTVEAPDGRQALPVFSHVDAMTAWRTDARPVPADGVRVALAAAAEHTPLVVLDPGSPHSCVIRRPTLWAIAQSQQWIQPHLNPAIQDIVQTACANHPEVRSFTLENADPRAQLEGADLSVNLTLEPGLDQAALTALLESLVSQWNAHPVFNQSVDQLGLKVTPADA